jgi:hypothetical protein
LPNHFFGDAAVRSDIGKGNKQRVIELEPFDGYSLMASLPVYAGMPLLFWHYTGRATKVSQPTLVGQCGRPRHGPKERGSTFDQSAFTISATGMPSNGPKEGRSFYDVQRRHQHPHDRDVLPISDGR